jgi:hypothetical protein
MTDDGDGNWIKNPNVKMEDLPLFDFGRRSRERETQTERKRLADGKAPRTKAERDTEAGLLGLLQYGLMGPLGALLDIRNENDLIEAKAAPPTAGDPNTYSASGGSTVEDRAMNLTERYKPVFRGGLTQDYVNQQIANAEAARGRSGPEFSVQPQAQARRQQMELLQLLEQSRGQDTIAKLQGQKALGESSYRAAQQQAMGGGLAQAVESTRQSQDIVRQVGEGAVSQDYTTRNMQNLLSAQGRGQDLQVTKAQNLAKIANAESKQAMANFYLALGDDAESALRRADVEWQKLYARAVSRGQEDTLKLLNAGAGIAGGALSAYAKG